MQGDSVSGRILVVDDDIHVRAFLEEALVRAGYSVASAGSGDEAIELIELSPHWPELVVVDLAMPRGDGFDVLARLRKLADGARLPALILSGFSDRRTRVAGLDAGANDFVAKPVDTGELLARVRAHLRVARAASQWHDETYVDPLTGLLNRNGFGERMSAEIAVSAQNGTPLSVAFFDLDGFKAINDQLGHRVGDRVLWMFGRLLWRSLRGWDVAARWGGDEFVVGLPGSDAASSALVVQRIRAAVVDLRVPRAPAPIDVSAGIAALHQDVPADAVDAVDRLVDAADRAMYSDKTRRIGKRPAPAPRVS